MMKNHKPGKIGIILSTLLIFLSLWSAARLSADEIAVGNAGYPGDSTVQGEARLWKDVLEFKPDTVVVMFGANDCGNPSHLVSVDDYERNLKRIIGRLKENGVKNIIVAGPAPMAESILFARSPEVPKLLEPQQKWNDRVRLYDEAALRAATEENAVYFDLFKLIEDHGGATANADSLVRNEANSRSNDGVHFTASGNRVIGEAMAKTVRSLSEPARVVICLGDSITYGSHMKGCSTVTGDTWPAYMWRALNPEQAAGGDSPRKLLAPSIPTDGNLVRNGDFEVLDDQERAAAWIFWAKNADRFNPVEGDAFNGKRFGRLEGAAESEALVRTDFFPVAPGPYRLRAAVRGSGKLRVKVGLYDPTLMTEVAKAELTPQWTQIIADFTVPPRYVRACVLFQTDGTLELDGVRFEPIEPSVREAAFTLESGTLSLGFSSLETGAGAVSIRNGDGTEFVNFPHAAGLWSIRFRPIADTKERPPYRPLKFDPERDESQAVGDMDGDTSGDLVLDAATCGGSVSAERAGDGLLLRWTGIAVGALENALDVTVRIEPTATGCLFTGDFENRSDAYTVFSFNMPNFGGLGGIGGSAQDDFLAIPLGLGRLIRNPASGRLFKSDTFYRANNSGHSMHFDALYNNGRGLLFFVPDPAQNAKRWLIRSTAREGLFWTLSHLPDNMKTPAPQRWSVPYEVEIRPFSGDWFDAAREYRAWALEQSWCSAGTLTERRGRDIPEWFLDITEWNHIASKNIRFKQREYFERFLADFSDARHGVWLTHWGLDNDRYDFPTPDRFPLTPTDTAVFEELAGRSLPAMGYIQVTGWNRSQKTYRETPSAEENLVRNYFGQNSVWGSDGDAFDASIAYPGEVWRNVIGDTVEAMARAGFKAAYLDSGNHGGFHLNFTPACSEHTGGGHDYIDKNRELLREARRRGRLVNPDFCTTTESFWEGNLDCLDAVLTVNSPNNYQEGARVTAIPLAQAVYHDRALCYATHYCRKDLKEGARSWLAKTAQSLIWGIMPGWEFVSVYYDNDRSLILRECSEKRFAAWDAARKFLEYGAMLRPPRIEGAEPLAVEWTRNVGPDVYSITLESVLGSAWTAPDGAFGLALYNISDSAASVRVELADYPLDENGFAAVYPADAVFTAENGAVTVEIPPRSPVVLSAPAAKP